MERGKLPSAEVIAEVRRLVQQPGLLLFDGHAKVKMTERDIVAADVVDVLLSGYHAEKRDKFNEHYDEWAYAIEGVTALGRKLRVAVAFIMYEPVPDRFLMVITAIGLD